MRTIYSDSIVVSFMHLPAYVSDDEIISKLKGLNIEILSDVKRRMHEKTKIADGTRYIKVKFPPNLKSLPYSMKFNTVEGLVFQGIAQQPSKSVLSVPLRQPCTEKLS